MAPAVHSVLIDLARVVVNRFDFGPGDAAGHHLPAAVVPGNRVEAVKGRRG